MKTAFHGTSADNWKAIQECGFICGGNQENWTPSNPNCVYAWDSESCEKLGEDPFQLAISNSEVPLIQSKDCRRVILEFSIEGLEYEDDFSCENMDGAIEICGKVGIERIVRVWEDKEDLSLFKLPILKGLLSFPLYNLNTLPYNDYIIEQVKNMKWPEIYWQDEFQVELTHEFGESV